MKPSLKQNLLAYRHDPKSFLLLLAVGLFVMRPSPKRQPAKVQPQQTEQPQPQSPQEAEQSSDMTIDRRK